MTASNHEILSAVSAATSMSIWSLVSASERDIPHLHSDSAVRQAVVRVAAPKIAALSDRDLARCAWMADRALDDALEAENTSPHSDCDCWEDCHHLECVNEENELTYISDWLQVVFDELDAACDARGIEFRDYEPIE